ncbi:hypothetical protein [Comamonas sp.]|nr:hypothetical protein [Comamonas sp.]
MTPSHISNKPPENPTNGYAAGSTWRTSCDACTHRMNHGTWQVWLQ